MHWKFRADPGLSTVLWEGEGGRGHPRLKLESRVNLSDGGSPGGLPRGGRIRKSRVKIAGSWGCR